MLAFARMVAMPPLRAFISYSSADEPLRAELDRHLALLKRERALETWTFRDIDAGVDWRAEIDAALERAELILMLVSASFVNSDYCWNVEMRRALQRNREGTARVVPIILRDCDWQSAPFAGLQALPPSAKPVTAWRPRDKAWTAVVNALRQVVTSFGTQHIESEAINPVPETPVQRAQRIAAETRSRAAREDKLRRSGVTAMKGEVASIFDAIRRRVDEISREVPDIRLQSGLREENFLVRLDPNTGDYYPLTLSCYAAYNAHEVEESAVFGRLLFGGVVLPHELNSYYLERPKVYETVQFTFALDASGRWRWRDSSGDIHSSDGVADQLINELLQLHADVAAGVVEQPAL